MDHDEPGEYTPEELERLKRIEEQLEEIGHTRFAEPDADELDDRLRDIESRTRAARRKQESTVASASFDPEASRGMGVGLSAAYAIIGLPLAGAGLGWLLDRWLHTSFGVFAGVVLGVVGGIYYAVLLSNRN